MIPRALICTDDPSLSEDLFEVLGTLEPVPILAWDRGVDGARRRVGREPWDVVILDANGIGVEAAGPLLGTADPPGLVVLEPSRDPERRAEWLAAGATAVVDPRVEKELLAAVFGSMLDRRRARVRAHLEAERAKGTRRPLSDLSSESGGMRAFLMTTRRVAASDSTVLLLGETGVGKEHYARAIHAESSRARGPFVAVNCAAIPEALLEAELFGHAAGAFTGAHRARRGWFELANSGVLFLDEVGEMPLHLQAKLLRVLQDREIQPVGGSAPVRLDLRVIAATNRDLEAEVAEGNFRADLYYRLAVVTLRIPPLRDRIEDLPALVAGQLATLRSELNRAELSISPPALELLSAHPWPGNVRELFNVLERAALLANDDELRPEDLPEDFGTPRRATGAGSPPRAVPTGEDPSPVRPYKESRDDHLEGFDRWYFERLLRETRGRVGRAAEVSGLTSRGLYEKLRRLGIRKEDYRRGSG